MHKWISKLPAEPLSPDLIMMLLAHAVALGVILVIINFIAGQIWDPPQKGKKGIDQSTRLLMSSANLLFLCVGLAGLMMLVNNNIVRAFGITAAIALVRFRIRIDEKSSSGSLLFAILAGMGCGLKEIAIAWALTGVYGLLLLSLILAHRYFTLRSNEAKLLDAAANGEIPLATAAATATVNANATVSTKKIQDEDEN